MDQNLTDDRTTVGSHDDRGSGGVFLMPSERRMREAVSIQPHARTLACAKPIYKSFRALAFQYDPHSSLEP